MKIKHDGHVLETNNQFVIEQLLKYGGKEVKGADVPKETKEKSDK